MPNRSKFQLMSGALLLCGLAAGSAQAAGPAPIAAEPMPAVRGLPATLPQDWIMVHDVNGGSITDGRVVFVDIGARPEVRAQVGASYLANFQLVPARHELYIAETFYSRVNRGERSDVISIYDTTTLQNIGEIALPGGKRAVVIPDPGGFQLINDGKWGLVFNFTPGASVTVVDLVGRRILSEVEIPGCSMTYPLAQRSFATLCGDGTMLSITLDTDGKLARTQSSQAFNNIDDDPMFMRAATTGTTAWFATFKGNLRSIDLSGSEARIGPVFALPAQTGGAPEWRPGGVGVIAADAAGRLYALMNPNGREGSHKDGGTEVWMVDPQTRTLIRRIPLPVRAVSIAATREAQSKLAVLGIDRTLYVFDPETGAQLRTVPSVGNSPLSLAVVP